jgi:hypothetical protein
MPSMWLNPNLPIGHALQTNSSPDQFDPGGDPDIFRHDRWFRKTVDWIGHHFSDTLSSPRFLSHMAGVLGRVPSLAHQCEKARSEDLAIFFCADSIHSGRRCGYLAQTRLLGQGLVSVLRLIPLLEPVVGKRCDRGRRCIPGRRVNLLGLQTRFLGRRWTTLLRAIPLLEPTIARLRNH